MEISSSLALGPLDGRYAKKTKDLQPFFSEYALMRYRIVVELEYLFALADMPELGIPEITQG